MQTKQHPSVSIEQVAKDFNSWRQNKATKFDPIPAHLKILLKQLTSFYSKKDILSHLKIPHSTLSSILNKLNQQNTSTLNISTSNTDTSTATKSNTATSSSNSDNLSNAHISNKNFDFIPLQLTQNEAQNFLNSFPSITTKPIDTNQNLKANPNSNPNPNNSIAYNTYKIEIIKPNGLKFTAEISEPMSTKSAAIISIVQTFICSN